MTNAMTIQEIRAIEARLPDSMVNAQDVVRLLMEVSRLRQGLWDIAKLTGAGIEDRTPDALVFPDIVTFTKNVVQDLRDDYDEELRNER